MSLSGEHPASASMDTMNMCLKHLENARSVDALNFMLILPVSPVMELTMIMWWLTS